MMEPKFIELHGDVTGQTLSANVAHIVMFSDREIVLSNEPMSRDGKAFHVTESYDDMKTLIKDSGILIHRADPRLDETHPLTMEGLKDMIGEPVWNSNLLRWELVKKADDLYITTCGTGQYDSLYDENDLIKTPLYRMRRE